MVIQHNLPAMNSHRQMGINNLQTSKNLEKLSSGYKINRAGDDAAGLAISEKMRGQIRGLNMATQNANNGISLIQTAEGGLNETHDILQRMRELAVQSANGTYDDETDRANLTKEVDALKSEIDRISSATNYNGIKLLDGSLSGVKGGAPTTQNPTGIKLELGDSVAFVSTTPAVAGVQTASAVTKADTPGTDNTYTISYHDEAGNQKELSVTIAGDAANADADATAEAVLAELAKNEEFSALFNVTNTAGALEFEAKTAGTGGATIDYVQQSITVSSTGVTTNTDLMAPSKAPTTAAANAYDSIDVSAAKSGEIFTINGEQFAFATEADAKTLDPNVNVVIQAASETVTAAESKEMAAIIQQKTGLVADGAAPATFKLSLPDASSGGASGGALTFQIGANGSKDQQVALSVGDMSSKGLGVNGVSVGTQAQANKAIDLLDKAINSVSGTRADLGALQNRLEHTVNNLGTTKENLQAAESSIRDVDMAKEMMEFTKNNILVQASQSMLAQSNQLPQGVLQLLR